MKRDIRKSVRFSTEENSIIEKMLKENGVSFSDFTRSKILGQKIHTKFDKEFLYELNKIGNNLNQIAKSVNADNKVSILTELVEIEKAIKSL